MCGSGHVFEKRDKKAALYLVESSDKKRWYETKVEKNSRGNSPCRDPRTCGTLSKTVEKRRTLTKRPKAKRSAGDKDKGALEVIGGGFGKGLASISGTRWKGRRCRGLLEFP